MSVWERDGSLSVGTAALQLLLPGGPTYQENPVIVNFVWNLQIFK